VEQLRNLEHLQELDLKIDSLKRGQSSLPANLKSIDDSLNKLKQAADVKKQQMIEIEKVQKQTRAALELNQDRLIRANGKMDEVHNAQEFQAATKEIDQLKKLAGSLEEQAGRSKVEHEGIEKELMSFEEQMEKFQKERDVQVGVLSGQDDQFKADIATLLEERAQYLPKVEQRILSQYERVRAARNGLGIVPALGGRCKGCNMVVPPQLFNEVQRCLSLHSCPSCHRILFVPASAAETKSPEEFKQGEK
jgi:predicted  nucleic acid-binding Zn-ribbon protein